MIGALRVKGEFEHFQEDIILNKKVLFFMTQLSLLRVVSILEGLHYLREQTGSHRIVSLSKKNGRKRGYVALCLKGFDIDVVILW